MGVKVGVGVGVAEIEGELVGAGLGVSASAKLDVPKSNRAENAEINKYRPGLSTK